MKIRVYGWDGQKPDRSTFDTFAGGTALEVVRSMMATPFAANLTPREFMGQTLARLGRRRAALPKDEAEAADVYLAQLAELGLSEPA